MVTIILLYYLFFLVIGQPDSFNYPLCGLCAFVRDVFGDWPGKEEGFSLIIEAE
jgi:hypothetical protein